MSKIRLYFKSQAIREDGEFLCLTDMWRAAKGSESKRPAEWLRHEATQEFSAYVADSKGVGVAHILRREHGNPRTGEGGSTWAHWQLAMAYAKYLSPEFHAWCNEVVRAVMQGQAPGPHQDVAALIRDALAQLVPAVMQAVDQRIDERLRAQSLGTVRPWEAGALKRRLMECADASVAIKRHPSRKSAHASLLMRVRTACGWSGTGARLDRMPIAALPHAERELAEIERELDKAGGFRALAASKQNRLFPEDVN